MSFNFFRSISLGKYLRLHITSQGISFSRVQPNITPMMIENTLREAHENHSRGMYNEWLTPKIIKYAIAVILFLVGVFLIMSVVLPRYQARQSAAAAQAGIVGLQPTTLKSTLEQQHFTCTDAQQAESYYIWDCSLAADQIQERVSYSARATNSVDYVNATYADETGALQSDGIQPFFAMVASVQYSSANIDEVKAWVNEHAVSGEAKKTFGGVQFTISGGSKSRTLEIGKLITK